MLATSASKLAVTASSLPLPLHALPGVQGLDLGPQRQRAAAQVGPDQWGGMRGWPTEVRIAPAALDPAQRSRLWEVSEELVGGRVGVAA